jgi:hypothetical protein
MELITKYINQFLADVFFAQIRYMAEAGGRMSRTMESSEGNSCKVYF